MEAARQKGEEMRNGVDALRRHVAQQVSLYKLINWLTHMITQESLEEGVRLRLEHQQREERQLKLQVQHQRDYLHNCAQDNVTMVSS